MRAETGSTEDWRDAAAYAPLLDAERSLFAWEWLRRDPGYRAAARPGSAALPCRPPPRADEFGLVAFEPPHLGVPNARPLWRRDANAYVLTARACRTSAAMDRFDLDALRPLASVLEDDEGEHLLLSDGLLAVRLDGERGAFSSGPVALCYLIEGVASAEAPLLTLRRFLSLCRTGRFARSLHGREARARRWILMLRAWDALASGADQRQIAQELLSRSVSEPRWRSREASIRSQAQRLVHGARRMADGGYWELLGGSSNFRTLQQERMMDQAES